MPATHDDITTIDELLALPEDGMRHELLEGVHVVTPSPAIRHQRVLKRLFQLLEVRIQACGNLELLWSPADIRLGQRSLLQPDLFVHHCPGSRADSWDAAGVPIVAIEVLSPSTASRDRGVKRRIYQRAGVAEYWIVDIDARLIERWTPEDARPEICDTVLECEIAGTLVTLPIADIFDKA